MKNIGIIIFLLIVIPAATLAADLDGFVFKKISAYDQKAVVKSPQGELQLVSSGNVIGGATITEIAADRVVLEQSDENGTALLIVRVKDGRQQISKVKKMLLKENALDIESGPASKESDQ